MTRGTAPSGPAFPRFRCRVCQEFVRGTESGHCPRCGLAAVDLKVLAPERRSWSGLAILAVGVLVVLAFALTRN